MATDRPSLCGSRPWQPPEHSPAAVGEMDTFAPVPRRLVLRLALPAAGAVIFLGVSTIHGALLPEFDSWHQSVSALAIGRFGWIQALNFLAFGVIILSTVPVWRRILAGTAGATWLPALTGTLGLSLVMLTFTPQDPAPGYDPVGLALDRPSTTGLVHLALAGVMAASSVGSMFVLASRFAADVHWPGWAAYSRVMGLLTIGCIAVYGVWSTNPTGLAGTFERMSAVIPAVWLIGVVWRLWMGAPFMRSPSADHR